MNPDWHTLSEINFLMYRRMTDHLEAALNALNQARDEAQRARAAEAVSAARDMYAAWSNLIRHNAGEAPLLTGNQEFQAGDLLSWMAAALQITQLPECDDEDRLRGNQAMIREALMALHSCAQTLGPGAYMLVERHPRGFWFRVRYGATARIPDSLDGLLAQMQANWREKTAAFELRSARDFLTINGSELFFTHKDRQCELSFFVYFVEQPNRKLDTRQSQVQTLLNSFNTDDTYRVITD
jgi:hypothetical protein